MNILLVSHPIYHRPLAWWVISHIIILWLLIASWLKSDWFGAGVLIMIWATYIWYIKQDQEVLESQIYDDGLKIADKVFLRDDIQHISIEIDESQPAFLAVYIQPNKEKRNVVYGFAPGQDNNDIADWIEELETYTTINNWITLDSFHKMRRWLRV